MNKMHLAFYDLPLKIPTGSRLIFGFLFFFSLLGYIPGLPYWLYNISTFITIPVFLVLVASTNQKAFTLNEILFLSIFILSLLASYIFSPFGFTPAGFLRASVPILLYYLTVYLGIKKDSFYYNMVLFLFILSFIFAFFQFAFQPQYVMSDEGDWIVPFDDIPALLKRPVSFLGNANVFGGFNVFCFIIIYLENGKNLSRLTKFIVGIMVFCNTVLFSKSRTSLLALVLVIFIYNVRRRNYKTIIVFLTIFLLAFSYVILNYQNLEILDDLFRLSALSETDDNSYTLRRNIAVFSYEIIIQRPFLGVGAGNEFLLMKTLNAPHKGMESASLFLLVERGLVGFFAYIYVLITHFLFSKNFYAVLMGIVIVSIDFTETVCVLPQLSSFLAIYLAVSRNQKKFSVKRQALL